VHTSGQAQAGVHSPGQSAASAPSQLSLNSRVLLPHVGAGPPKIVEVS
jgi:hypothetical protein